MLKEAWAWEIMRRNSDYIAAWVAHLKQCQKQSYLPENRKFKKNEMVKASEFGLLHFVDPDISSEFADVFWSPKTTPYVLNCSLIEQKKEKCTCQIILADIASELVYVETFDGNTHLIVKDKCCSIQLLFDRKLELNTLFNFEVHIPALCNFSAQLQIADCLSQFISFKKCHEYHLLPASKAKHNIASLFAFDLSKQNFSQREIAIRIYGEEAILDGWDGASDHIRSKTRRIIKRGEQLVAGGYKAFLKSTNT